SCRATSLSAVKSYRVESQALAQRTSACWPKQSNERATLRYFHTPQTKQRRRIKEMAHTNVLLREDVDDLGARGEIVRVKAGYARNYLLPRKLAVEATAGNVKQIEGERKALAKREARDRAGAELQAEQLRTLSLD